MNQRQLIDALAASSGESKAAVSRVLSALGEVVHTSVAEGETVPIPSVGKIVTSWRGPRVLRQVKNGRKMRIGGRYVAQLRPSGKLKETAANRTDQSWRDPAHQKAWRLAETLIGDLALYHEDKIPQLADDQDLRSVEDACASALGDAWRRARTTYESDVPSPVRAAKDHLAQTAREHWSS